MTDALVVAVVGWFIVPNNNVSNSVSLLENKKKKNRYKSTKEKSNT